MKLYLIAPMFLVSLSVPAAHAEDPVQKEINIDKAGHNAHTSDLSKENSVDGASNPTHVKAEVARANQAAESKIRPDVAPHAKTDIDAADKAKEDAAAKRESEKMIK